MKKIYMIICVFGFLCLMLGCPVDFGLMRGTLPSTKKSHKGGYKGSVKKNHNLLPKPSKAFLSELVIRESKNGDSLGENVKLKIPVKISVDPAYVALLESLGKLKSSLNYEIEGFDASRFDSIFSVWDNKGVESRDGDSDIERDKNNVYASLMQDVDALNNLKIVVDNLVSDDGHDEDFNTAVKLLSNLKSSAEYVSDVTSGDSAILSENNLALLSGINNTEAIGDIKNILDIMLLVRNNIIERVKILLRGAAGLANMRVAARSNIRGLNLHLDKIIKENEFIYESIFSTKEILGLKGLRDLIRDKVDKLI
ncbi:hypothetical protein [Borrelia coriaceae]|nr:hypothetical protein [Borrelia coriaceae]